MKNFSIPISKYLEFTHPQYIYLQIIPHKATRNYDSSRIAKAIQRTFRSINKRVKFDKKKLCIETNFKISYAVDIKKGDTCFYFILPKQYLSYLTEKIREIWSKVDLQVVDPISAFGPDTVYYQLNNKKEDALSLEINKTSNEPLNSILAVMEIMQQEDRVTLIYNFLPKSQFSWGKRYESTRKKIEELQPIDKDKATWTYRGKAALAGVNYIFTSILSVLTDFMGDEKEVNTVFSELLVTSNILETNKRLSDSTQRKKDKTVLDAQILIAASSTDRIRRENITQSVCNSFSVLDAEGGNELIAKKVKLKKKQHINIEDYKFSGVDENTFSVDETQNFIQQPGRQLMKILGIHHVEVEEAKVPDTLSHGYISLGEVKCKGEGMTAYIQDTYDKGSLPLVMIGAQGSGKSKFDANYHKMANKRKEGGVVIDYIKNCELSDDIIKDTLPEDLIILDYTKPECIQSLAFNEYKVDSSMTIFERLELMNKQAQQILTFVNSINVEQPLQARMRKYLSAATNVVFACGESRFKEVVKCLEDHVIRANYIKKLNEEEIEFLEDEIKSLHDLDEYSKATVKEPTAYVIGTKMDRIEGILDRISLLREDFKLKYMFNKSSANNIDFAEELEAGKTIIIRMPQDKFSMHSKNVIVTFLISKIWNATEIRGSWNAKPRPTHISIDEIFQCKTAMKMLNDTDILPQTRKFGCKFVLSCQFLDQIDTIAETLEGAGASFMLLGGTSEKDFKHFENKIENFDYEDLRDMKQYSSMNLIYYTGGYSSFISKLPKPIKKKRTLKIKEVKLLKIA
ncbi:hypothetical protein [Clostridium lacusfryxellense]|uniref:hypothetical protein n=1 Tax=Clostridium lacusfryxellense TaxID=205328 RepID=UPI001C0E1F13|nr:hypothetical protein [Clostridium lacusfryxellense]MBU3112022.1 hypothetical protein [Clostridium lacusfryxellense]